MRYLDPTLAAYVGESVIIRYDPRDVAEIRVFYQDRFLCRAICQELAEATVPLRDIMRARNRHRRELRHSFRSGLSSLKPCGICTGAMQMSMGATRRRKRRGIRLPRPLSSHPQD